MENQRIEEGTIYCPSCNRSEHIELVDVFTRVDPKVFPDGETPNVYIVSFLKCKSCSETFELERVDPRPLTQIIEIAFPNEFTVYTTSSPQEAMKKAVEWYTSRFDDPLGKPIIQTVGTTIFTSDPRFIVIPPQEGE